VSAVFFGRRGGHQSIVRHLTSRLFKTLLHWLCGTPPDAGLFVALDRRMVTCLLAFGRPGPSVLAMIGCTGLPLISIPLARASRSQGHSAYSAWRRISMGVRVLAWVLVRKWSTPSPR
jgi:dolichol-phosphate mannosyltransferase/undecaprenyl-phosphate 4-deoxy-4-formamido-L-arabinose transferase